MDEFKKHIQQNKHLIIDDEPSMQVWNSIATTMQTKNNVIPSSFSKSKQNVVFSIFKYAVAACVIGLAVIGCIHLFSNNTNVTNNVAQAKPSSPIIINTNYDTQQNIIEPDTPMAVLKTVAKKFVAVVTSNAINEDTINALASIATNNNNENIAAVNYVDSQFTHVISLQKNVINNTPIYAENASYFKNFITDFKQMEKDEKRVKKAIAQQGFDNDLLDQLINVYQQKLNVLKAFQTEINKTNTRFKQNRNIADTTKVYFLNI